MKKLKLFAFTLIAFLCFGVISVSAFEKTDITPIVSIVGWTYGSSANNPSITGNTGNGAVTYEYKVKDADDSTYTVTVPTDAGDYTVRATIAPTDNYNGKEVTTDFAISKKVVSFTLIIKDQVFDNYNLVREGWHTLSEIFSVNIPARMYLKEGSDKYVGTQTGVYELTLTDESFKNHTFAEGKTGSVEDEFEITPAASTLTLKSEDPEIAKRNTLDLSSLVELSNTHTSDITYSATDLKTGITLEGSVLSASNEATANQVSKITVSFAGKDLNGDGVNDYSAASDLEIYVKTIGKTLITIDGLTYTDRKYDTTPMVPTGTLTHAGYTGAINVLYEGTDGTTYNSEDAPTDAGRYKVTYSIPSDNESYTGSKVYTFTIDQATPSYTIPSGLTGIVYNMLSTVELPVENNSGFTWISGNQEIKAGNKNYAAMYTPEDTKNYETIFYGINIPVYGKSKYDVNTSVVGGNGTITPYSSVVEGENKEITFTPAVGYMIDTVRVNDELVTVTANTYTITNITEPKNIVVTYKKIPYTITVNEVTGATITPNGTINVSHGDDQEITITANSGYRLKSVKVNDEEKLPLTENKITLTNITEDQEVIVTVAKIEYDVTAGAGQKHTIGKAEDATFRIDADKDLFLKVYLNDEELLSAFYTITEGSTIITLKQDFLNNLLPGTYTLKATFSDGGEANTTFVVAQPAEDNPTTGDSIMLAIILGSVSLIGLFGAGIYLKKKKCIK